MSVEQDHVEYLAKLARLNITEAEKAKYAKQISAILEYFKQLDEVNVDGVTEMEHISDLENVTREDKVKQIFEEEKALAEAPELGKRQIKVKPVM